MAKPALTLRSVKGAALSFDEMDTNLGNLANAVVQVTAGGTTSNLELNSGFTIANSATVTATLAGSTVTLTANVPAGITVSNTATVSGTVAAGVLTLNANSLAIVNTLTVSNTATVSGTVSGGAITLTANVPSTVTVSNTATISGTAIGGALTLSANSTAILNTLTVANTSEITGSVSNGQLNLDVNFPNINLSAPGPIGNATPSTGAFTTLSTTGNIDVNNNYIKNAVISNVREQVFNAGSVSGNVSINAENGSIQTLTVSANITLNSNFISNLAAGESITLVLTQATNTSPRLLSSNIRFAGGTKTLSTANASIDTMHITFDGVNHLAALIRGYA